MKQLNVWNLSQTQAVAEFATLILKLFKLGLMEDACLQWYLVPVFLKEVIQILIKACRGDTVAGFSPSETKTQIRAAASTRAHSLLYDRGQAWLLEGFYH